MEIKRSEVEKWVLADNQYACTEYIDDWFEKAKNPHATVFGELSPAVQAVLKNAPRHCRQRYCFDGAWILDPEDEMTPFYAYRLNHACELVNDSQWAEYPVKATTIDSIDEYIVTGMPRSPFLWSICGYVGYVCVKVRDASGDVFYVASWDGQYGHEITFNTVDDLVAGNNYMDGGATPLTPIAVVFERGE